MGNNTLTRGPHDIHLLIVDQATDVFRQGTGPGTRVTSDPPGVTLDAQSAESKTGGNGQIAVYTSRVIETPFPFNEVVPSWNVDVPEGAGFMVELRVGRSDEDLWSRYYYLDTWGQATIAGDKHLKDEHGWLNIDYFQSEKSFDRLQYRLHLVSRGDRHAPVLRRFGLAVSNTSGDAELARRHRRPIDPGPARAWARRLDVPFLTQTTAANGLASRICSPTSTAMVLRSHGIEVTPEGVADLAYDPEHEIYGNWARTLQAAHVLGAPGYVERFGDWAAVKRHIANGRPVIASIRADAGELRGAPYRQSAGHLLVIVGFDPDGNVEVNDPAARSAQEGQTSYAREDMERVWLDNGGVGYVLLKPD